MVSIVVARFWLPDLPIGQREHKAPNGPLLVGNAVGCHFCDCNFSTWNGSQNWLPKSREKVLSEAESGVPRNGFRKEDRDATRNSQLGPRNTAEQPNTDEAVQC